MNSKISASEECLENISIKNRASNITEDYVEHCTTQWLEAKQYLDTRFPKTDNAVKFHFLCDVIQVHVISYLHNNSHHMIM